MLISDKTGFTLTAITVAKSYIGVGCLAIPYGFKMCGYQLALLMLAVSAVSTYFCCWVMTECSKFYGSNNVKNFSDLGKKLFGRTGHIIVFLIFNVNQYFTCVSYVIFFLETLKEHFEGTKPSIILSVLLVVLVSLSLILRSMKEIQKLQTIALVSQLVALVTVYGYSINTISTPSFEKSFTSFDYRGIPYFFGICTFAFEGPSLTLEIYRQMENKRADFPHSLATGLSIAAFVFQLTGILVFGAFA